MATYLQLHALENMSEDEVIKDGKEEYFANTDIKTPRIVIAKYNYLFSTLGLSRIPTCVPELRGMMHIQVRSNQFKFTAYRQYDLRFIVLNERLALRIINIIINSWIEGGQEITLINPLREFMASHMGKKVFLIEL